MDGPEYAEYLRSLKKYYGMNSKKKSEFEFIKGNDGLIKKNVVWEEWF